MSENQPVSFVQKHKKVVVSGLLFGVLLLAAFLRFYQMGATGVGNEYYAAAVKSMLMSWKNFFFVAFEPGGSVSVDKPPLGFWIETISAYFLGVNGFALALPNAIAGVLSVFMVYLLVKRPFGEWIGLASALCLAVTPVAISTERNNTIDGMLVFVLLLAAWAFLQAVYTNKIRWLFLGALIVGLGFNIKMLQAFLPLPAFYALYFFGAKHGWWAKVMHLSLATILLVAVSLSWAIVVDLTPSAQRPYVDSSSNNSVMELIFSHNGLKRLTRSGGGPGSAPDGGMNANQTDRNAPTGNPPQFADGQNLPPQGQFAQGQPPQPPQGFGNADGGPGGPLGDGGQPGGSMDFGTAGTLRLFTSPLVGEASWLLPFVLAGLVMLVLVLRKQPFGEQHLAAILWAGWLLPEAIYFTYSSGLMHAYYLIMLGAPLAALTGMTIWALWKVIEARHLFGWALAALFVTGTLLFQAVTLWGSTALAPVAIVTAGIIFGLALILVVASRMGVGLIPATLTLLLVAMLIAPMTWSALTTFNASPNSGLPYAGPVQSHMESGPNVDGNDELQSRQIARVGNRPMGLGNGGGQANQKLLNYLLTNTEPGTYLVATGRANSAAPYILATGRPVLALGGFLGNEDSVTVDQFTALVKNGQLRFVLGEDLDRHQAIAAWVKNNCTPVDTTNLFGTNSFNQSGPGGQPGNTTLYDCKG